MTSQDFKAIAEALRSCQPPTDYRITPISDDTSLVAFGRYSAWEQCCIAIADTFSNLNPRFRRDLFLAACRAS